MIYDKINWRPGTASAYESEWSLIRKYCYLNRITTRDFDDHSSDRHGNFQTDQSSDGLVVTNERSFPLCLNEPGNLIRFRRIEHYLLPGIIAGKWQNWVIKYLRYCPICISQGYHSPIQQLPWVALCPLHSIPLREYCSICGNQIVLENWPNNWRNNDGLHRKPGECWCDIWHGLRSPEWPPGLRFADTRPIGAYLKWLKSLTTAPEAFLAYEGLKGIVNGPITKDNALELFGIWSSVLPPPPAVRSYLIENRLSGNLPLTLNISLPASKADELISLIHERGYRGLMTDMYINYANQHRRGGWYYVLKRTTRMFARAHRNCHHIKQSAKRDKSLSSYFELDLDFAYICPRLPYIEVMKNKWIILWGFGHLLERVMSEDFRPPPVNDFELRFDNTGLLHPRDRNENRLLDLGHKSKWVSSTCDNKITLFIGRLLCCEAMAIASSVIATYHRCMKSGRSLNFSLRHLRFEPIRHPYVLITLCPPKGLLVRIWPRHAPITMPSSDEDVRDWHQMEIVKHLRSLKSNDLRRERRRTVEMFDRIRKSWELNRSDEGAPQSKREPQ